MLSSLKDRMRVSDDGAMAARYRIMTARGY